MSWATQGRQYHGWFGHGTADTLFDPRNVVARIDAMAYAAVAHMPHADRRRDSVAFDRARLERLRSVIVAWLGARSLGPAAFAERFVDPSVGTAAIEQLRSAAEGAGAATTHQDLARASADLAGAMRAIGLGKWSRFLADAAGRADANMPAAGKIVLAQVAPPTTATDAGGPVVPDPQRNRELADFGKRFDAATETAYRQYSRDCSHYLQTFLRTMGFADTPYRTANEFMAYVQEKGSGWQRATEQEAIELSASGHIVVAGLAKPGGSGHVAVVGPRMIAATLIGGHPMSPQVYSGSAATTWTGARSQGEHSVADGWTESDRNKITYWVKQ